MAQTGHKALVLGSQGVLGSVLARTFAPASFLASRACSRQTLKGDPVG